MKRPPLLLLFLLAVGAVAAFGALYLRGRGGAELGIGGADGAAGAKTGGQAGSAQAPSAGPDSRLAGEAAPGAAAASAPGTTWQLVGRVEAPEGIAFAPGEIWVLPVTGEDDSLRSFSQLMGAAFSRGKTQIQPGDRDLDSQLLSPLVRLLQEREPKPPLRAPLMADGSFRLEAMPTAWAQLYLHHPLLYCDSVPTVVAGTDRVARAAPLRARVGGQIAGKVVDDKGAPVARADVDAARPMDPMDFLSGGSGQGFEGMMLRMQPRLTRCDAQGRFELWGVPAGGMLDLLARAEPHGPGLLSTRVVAGTRTEVVLALRPAAHLTLIVVGPEGQPVAGCELRVSSRDRTARTPQLHRVAEHKHSTDADGRCVVTALPAGHFRVETRHAEWTDVSAEVELAEGARQDLRLQLLAGLGLAGIVVDGAGAPVSGATVGIPPLPNLKIPMLGTDFGSMGGEDFMAGLLDAARRKTTTGADGRFALRGLVAEETEVFARAPGLAAGRSARVTPPREDLRIVLQPVGAVTGRVVGKEGAPPPEFTAEASIKSFLVIDRPVHAVFTRQEGGRFQLAELAPGSVTLRVSAKGYATWSQGITVEPGATTEAGEIRLRPAAAVHGVVVDPEGAPQPGVVVRRRKGGMADMAMMDLLTGGGDRTVTDSDGQFALRGLPAGATVLEATVEGWAPTASEKLTLRHGEDLGPVRLVLDGGGTLTGELKLPRDAVMEGWSVIATCQRPAAMAMAHVTPQRTFRIEHLAPGSYEVATSPMTGDMNPGDNAADMQRFMKEMMTAARQQLKSSATVKAGETTHVVLAAEDADEDTPRITWNGAVRSAGRPVADAVVMSAPLGEAHQPAMAMTDAQGRFQLEDLTPGRHRVTVKRGLLGGGLEHHREVTVPESGAFQQDVDLPAGELRGKVVARGTERGLRGVWIQLRDSGRAGPAQLSDPSTSATLSDAQGEFRFEGLADGSYQLEAMDLGLFAAAEEGTARLTGLVVQDGSRRQDLRLEVRAGGSLAVEVLGPRGEGMGGCTVWLLDSSGRAVASAFPVATDGQGRAWFGSLPPGTYQAMARHETLAPGAGPATRVDEGQEHETRISLRPGCEVEVEIRDAQGAVLAGAQVVVRDPEGREVVSLSRSVLRAPEAGVYALGRLRPGVWTVRMEHARLGTHELQITVVESGRQRFVLRP